MKMNTLSSWLFLFFSFGVFALKADGVESVSATVGDPVTLHTGVTLNDKGVILLEYLGPNQTCWAKVQLRNTNIYGSECNEMFKDRLQFDHQTGSLTIMNTRTTDSGLYKLKVMVNSSTINKTFNVSVTVQRLRWLMFVVVVLFALTVGTLLYCCWRKRTQDDELGERKITTVE